MNKTAIMEAKLRCAIYTLQEQHENELNSVQITSAKLLLEEVLALIYEIMDNVIPVDDENDELLLSGSIKVNGAIACLQVQGREWVAYSLLKQAEAELGQAIETPILADL